MGEKIDYTTLILKCLNFYFDNNVGKMAQWLNTANPLLGNLPPIEMMMIGKSKKLFCIIKNSIEGNNP